MIFYATCGQKHRHILENGKTWDKNGLIQIEAKNRDEAQDFLYEEFGQAWSDFYSTDLEVIEVHFPNGVVAEYKA